MQRDMNRFFSFMKFYSFLEAKADKKRACIVKANDKFKGRFSIQANTLQSQVL
jgi:hypothetical protein